MLFLFDKIKHLERHIAQIETSTPAAVAGAVDNSAHSGAEAGQHGDSSSGAGVAGAEGGAGKYYCLLCLCRVWCRAGAKGGSR